jgi:hypothetical protein
LERLGDYFESNLAPVTSGPVSIGCWNEVPGSGAWHLQKNGMGWIEILKISESSFLSLAFKKR